jgi:hypothetical protein
MRIYADKNNVPYAVFSGNDEITLTEYHKGIYAMGGVVGKVFVSSTKENSYCVVYDVDEQCNFVKFV